MRRAGLVLAGALMLGCPAGDPPDPGPGETPGDPRPEGPVWFEDVAATAGVEFVCLSGHSGPFLFPEIVLGGAALLDHDGDGDLDVYLVQGGSITSPETNPPNRLYRNDGDGSFTDVTAESGAGDTGYGIGAAAGDFDNDGDVDLYLTNLGPNTLLRNEGDGTFTDVTEASGSGDPGWGNSAAFLDHDHDGDLDLFVTNYINWTPATELTCYNNFGARDYCLPLNYNSPARDTLYRNDGDGTFTDVSQAAGLETAFGNGMGVAPGDYDGDGRIDVFVANDSMMNQLWINQGDGTFVDEALLRGCAIDEHGKAKAGMGVVPTDADDDGDLDLLVVNLFSQSDSFYRNDSGYFADRTAVKGLAMHSRPYTRFGVGLVDLDNDGWLDLYQANGDVVISAEPLTDDPFAQPNLLLRGGPDGRLEPVSPRGGVSPELIHTSRAAAFGDLDNDGGVDVVVVNRDGPAYVLHNVVQHRGNWLLLRVLDEHGRDALGAEVTLGLGSRRLRRDVQPAYSYCAGNDARVHVGLGDASTADDVRVRWTDGGRESFGDLAAGRVVTLRRGEGSVTAH